jgi:hypothetical protein
VAAIVSVLGGVSLAGGVYRVFEAANVARWTDAAHRAFPGVSTRTTVFAADWLGRLFATDTGRTDDDGEPLVLLLEPGTGEALELPVTVRQLHASELVEAADAALAAPFYEAWRAASGDERPLRSTECVGYRVPLFLGGADGPDNLERTDMDVYWELSAQLLHRASGRLDAQVTEVTIDGPKRRLFRRNR